MTAATWQTVGVIGALAFGIITTFYLVKSSIREQVRQRDTDQARLVDEAKAPLLQEKAQLAAQVEQLAAELRRRDDVHRAEVDRKDQRITELEDRLYGRGSGR